MPNSTSDGNNDIRGAKLNESTCRRLYQLIEVQAGVEYTFSIDILSANGANTEVFILNTEITTGADINASKSDPIPFQSLSWRTLKLTKRGNTRATS